MNHLSCERPTLPLALAFNRGAPPPAKRIEVLVLHSDPIPRAGLSLACGRYPDLQVREAENSQDEPFADVVVADPANGLALAARSASDRSTCKVLIVGGSDREWDIRRALERGVRGYLIGGCTLDEVAEGIRAVNRGDRHLSPQAAARLADSIYSEPLTGREEDVLRLVAHGLCNKTIANRLGISAGTVKSHLKATFGKLNVQSRTQAIVLMEQRGLLEAV